MTSSSLSDVRSSSSSSSILRSNELTSSTLLKSNPTYHSKVYKLKVPFIYRVTPAFLLSTIHFCLYPLLKLCNIKLKPYWVERYCILIGNYMYKFKPNNPGSMGKNNMKMKGSPIPLETMRLSSLHQTPSGVVSSNNTNSTIDLDTIPEHDGCNGYFAIDSNTKTSYYATETQMDAQTWANVLHSARQECITQKMGHSKKPLDRNVEYVNMMGKRIIDRNERISNMMKKKELNEVELTCLHGSGAVSGMPRGYYG
eukprot:CAMPEP_0203681234 /NCGR_PEP_ID=MMETSP0090-20130426/42231_1 /ASSEMBLY_ACC=CAM_ASM_001088 /TAXON_ID=426623 /ORGANISM="Chaetoceros affinis, Strain CCMP159" /LENGTH=254 /DNA_ID=CAMNT_0050549659 /DNA_START=106 /DNA_END=870 /DNA_ORIENTATION=+